MTLPPPLRKIVIWILFTVALLIIIAAGLSVYIPRALESRILPGIAEKAGIRNLSAPIRHIGFTRADIGPLNFGPDPQTSPLIDTIQLRYSPGGLYARHVESILLKGLTLSCDLRDGDLFIQGVSLAELLAGFEKRDTKSAPNDGSPPLTIGRIRIAQASLSLKWKGRRIQLPIRLEIQPASPHWQSIDLKMRLNPRDQALYLTATIDLNQKSTSLTFHTKDLHPSVFSDFIGLMPGLTANGSVDIQGSSQMGLDPLQISDSRISIKIREGHFAYGKIRLDTGLGKEDQPFSITLAGKDREWDLSADALAGVAMVPFQIPRITSRIALTDKGFKQAGNGTLIVGSPLEELSGFLPLPDPIMLPLHHSASYSEDKGWSFSLLTNKNKGAASALKKIRFPWKDMTFSLDQPEVAISGTKDIDGVEGKYLLTLTGIKASKEDASIALPRLTARGQGHLRRSPLSNPGELTFALAAADIRAVVAATSMHLSKASLKGRYRWKGGPDDRAKATLSFSNTKVLDPALRTELGGIKGTIPLAWPLQGPGEKGRLAIGTIRWQDLALGSLGLTIQQDQGAFLIDGTHTSTMFPGLLVNIKGKSTLLETAGPTVEMAFDVAQYHLPSELGLEELLPALKGIRITGALDAHLGIRLEGTGMTGSLKGDFTDGSVAFEEQDGVIDGINGSLFFPDLPQLRSAPKQRLRFENASFGSLKTTDGQIDFQIESAKSLFIEKSSLKWGGGNLYAHAMRIQPAGEDYNLIVYCDRLNLAQLLEQIASVKAEGRGAVNGRIPLRYHNGKLHFKDGFLYSTPGDGGSIRLTQTEVLTAGIPQDTPQYTQLELAREALKDYDYKWVKLNLETQGEMLLMGMQLDGKPANLLPFVYRKELGRFARIEAGGKGSRFQGISLDVNFKVPLNRILPFGNPLKEVFGGSR